MKKNETITKKKFKLLSSVLKFLFENDSMHINNE